MAKQIFINLPVKDLGKATDFYEKLGFRKEPMFSDQNASCLIWSDTISVMLLTEDFYKRFIPGKTIADAQQASEVLLCLSMDSREEVDDFIRKAEENGGTVIENTVASEYGDSMYGKDVQDLDGHVWELLYMDMSKYPAENTQNQHAAPASEQPGSPEQPER